ncbi:MAG: hypothetical protein NTX25_23275 [Proteobacteria bacterium]|nr:hypothetical protein [Pseudomonadota bacterium]
MTVIDNRPIKTVADFIAALNEFPSDSRFEIVFKSPNTLTRFGSIDIFAAIHQSMRQNEGAIVEIVVNEL